MDKLKQSEFIMTPNSFWVEQQEIDEKGNLKDWKSLRIDIEIFKELQDVEQIMKLLIQEGFH